MAFLPMAFVDHPHADGHLLGMGVALPVGLTRAQRREAYVALGRISQVRVGRMGTWRLSVDTSARSSLNLRPETWTAYPRGATHWSSVTPIVYDRHPKTKDPFACQKEGAAMIRQACTHIGLPEPREVIVTPVSAHPGVPPAYAFPRWSCPSAAPRRHTHAIIEFDQPVCGPLILGAGRYHGYGLCRPLHLRAVDGEAR